MNHLTHEKLTKIFTLQGFMKAYNLRYKSKSGKVHDFGEYFLHIAF